MEEICQENYLRIRNHSSARDGLALLGCDGLARLTPNIVSKITDSRTEVERMEFAARRTTIPVPRARRVSGMENVIAMDFISGRRLRETWDELSWWMKFRIACTLRLYIAQLRRLTHLLPGDDGSVEGALFDDRSFGAFRNFGTFRYWCQIVAMDGYLLVRRAGLPAQLPSTHDSDWSGSVFTHGDLHLANLILGDDGRLWVLDWGSSGHYPSAFESLAMARYDDAPTSWSKLNRWITGFSVPSLSEFWGHFSLSVEHGRWGEDVSMYW